MITGKIKKFVPIFIILILTILVLTCSCSKKNDDLYNNIFSDDHEHQHTHQVQNYRIVVSDSCDSELYEKAMLLSYRVEERTEANCFVVHEHDAPRASDAENTRDILVGLLEREESESVMKNYKYNDYGYCYKDGAAVIAGISKAATIKAIDKFIQDIIPYSDCEALMNQNAEYYNKDTYSIDEIKLCGFELFDYIIVYPGGNDRAYSAAISLRDRIAERSGYYMRVYPDSSVKDGVRAVNVGRTRLNRLNTVNCMNDEFRITAHSGGVSLFYGSDPCLEGACERMLSILSAPNGEGKVDVSLEFEIRCSVINREFKVMTLEAAKKTLKVAEISTLCKRIKLEAPDVLRLCGYDEKTVGYISDNLGSGYAKVHIGELEVYHIYKRSCFDRVSARTENLGGFSISSVKYTPSGATAEVEFVEAIALDPSSEQMARNAADYLNGLDLASAVIFENFEGEGSVAFSESLENWERILNVSDFKFYVIGDGFTAERYTVTQNAQASEKIFLLRLYKIEQ